MTAIVDFAKARAPRAAHPELLGINDWIDDLLLMDTFDRWLAPRLAHRAEGFRQLYELFYKLYEGIFVETGCLRQLGNWAGDGQSTFVFDLLARKTDSKLYSVDYDCMAVALAQSVCSAATMPVYAESVHWLWRFGRPINLLYLDSMDFVQREPLKSAKHHLFELCSAMRWLDKKAVVAVDDMERDDYGKGALINEYMAQIGATRLYAGYQYIWMMP